LSGSAPENSPQSPPRVTIVTPVLDGVQFIARAVESVLAQDYPNVEYIVVDGGSRDGTMEIVRSYGDRIRTIVLEGTSQAQALNAGFAAAGGDIFGFINADDAYLPGAISAAVATLASNPAAPFVYGEADHVDEGGSRLGPYPVEPYDAISLGMRCIVCQPAAFFRAEAFRAAGGFDPALNYALDYDLWIRLSRTASPVKFDSKIAFSCMHPGNKTLGRRRAAYEESMRVLRRHYGYVPYDWVVAYSNHVFDRSDNFFQESRGGRLNVLSSLALGLVINRHRVRYLRDWLAHRGFGINRS
jgi:glycosyltransferase involved in cell wall biosynthesis